MLSQPARAGAGQSIKHSTTPRHHVRPLTPNPSTHFADRPMTTRSAGTWATAPLIMRRYGLDAMLASCARYDIAGGSVLDPNTVPRRLDLVVMAAYEFDEDGAHLLAAEGV